MAMEDDDKSNFEYFSGEYAQALQALQAIESQSSTLKVMGYTDDLRQFIEQFIDMATRVRAEAAEKNEPNFVAWFDELISKAEALRGVVSDR
ncbi:MAG TPA: hypothetical protein VN181_11365 [Thermoanaerobaculia bacterium]|nr:hypothetical protein [Thermoanaerobaculia bacterium]